MVEKMGHVKNPLTVIAIFAGLAELSGTAVLPALEKEIQRTYVWFLMLFPLFLVAVFFFVLYKKHHVLYAPTDFKDDKTFTHLFEAASSSSKVGKLLSESNDLTSENGGVGDANGTTDKPRPAVDGIAESLSPESISAEQTLRNSFQGIGLLAEELVAAKLTKEYGIRFERNLAVKGQPRLVFDAVASSSDRAVVLETRFTRTGGVPEDRLAEYFRRVDQFSNTLPDNLREKFEFVLAIVTDSEDSSKLLRIDRLLERAQALANSYPFNTTVRLFHMKELEREFAVS